MKNVPYYTAAVIIFIILKFWFSDADNNGLIFLLFPTDKLTGLMTGSASVFISDKGFYHEKLNIIIDKSCSGFNYLLLCLLLFVYLLIKHIDKPLYKFLVIPASFIISYLITILVNSSRIFISIVIQNQTLRVLPNHQNLIHASIGTITYLTFLILTFCLTEYILNQRKKHEVII